MTQNQPGYGTENTTQSYQFTPGEGPRSASGMTPPPPASGWIPGPLFAPDEELRTVPGAIPGGQPLSPGVAPGFTPYFQAPTFTWQPRIDIFEEHDFILIVVEVPGAKPDQIKLESRSDMLTIQGDVPQYGNQLIPRYRERTAGGFFRQIPLPPQLNPDQAQASGSDGLIEIRIPKQQQQSGKSIEIQH